MSLQHSQLSVRIPCPARSIAAPKWHPDTRPARLLRPSGIGATSIGLWQYYQAFTAYPDSSSHPVRSKLRAALRLQQSGDYARASAVFQQAYDLALDLFRTGELAPEQDEALLRLSGIAVRWGGLWEEAGDLARAIEVYDTGFQPVAAAIEGFTKTGPGGGGGWP